ncbi:MAG: ABC transporter substrate-binding protein [Thermoplasmata archaeon]
MDTPAIDLVHTPEPGFFYLAYNMRKPSFGYNEAGEDIGKAFRQAVAHCIDKNRLVSKLLLNLGVAGTGPVSPFSNWYNSSVPTYDFDPQKAKQILADAGYKVKKSDGTIVTGQAAIDAAGINNWWVNPNGTNIGSSSGGMIEMLFPEGNYDPIAAQPGLMIAEQMRTIGIYAEGIAMDFGSIVDRADIRDFDIYALRWNLEDEPADYLWAFFHSSQAAVGQNYPGYRNESFDSVIGLARSTGDYETKRKAVFEAQSSICYDLPYDVLYYKTKIEAYRSDRFIGWEAGDAGSIFNYMSLLNIHPPSPYRVAANFITPPSAMASNSIVPITLVVRDQDGNPLAGAKVKLNATRGALSADVAVTDSAGRATVNFTAPYVPLPDADDPNYNDTMRNGVSALLQIVTANFVSDDGTLYDPAPQRVAEVRVFPEDAMFLSVSITADPDFLIVYPPLAVPCTRSRSGAEFTYAVAEVRDRNGQPVANATVAMTASPVGLNVEPAEGRTDAEGKASFMVSVGDFQLFDKSLAEFTITAVATDPHNPNITAANSMLIYVVLGTRTTPPPEKPELPVAEVAISLIAISVAAAAYAAFARRRKKP